MNPLQDNRYTCLLCGKSYARKHDMQRHRDKMHGDEDSDNSERDEEERNESEEEEEENESDSNELEDNEVYRDWYEEAVRDNREAANQKYRKYLKEENVDDARAREKAYAKTLWSVKKYFFDSLEVFLTQYIRLRDEDVFQDIVTDIHEKTEGGMDLIKAVKRVVPKHKHHFESLFDYEDEEESEAMEDDDDSSQMGGGY